MEEGAGRDYCFRKRGGDSPRHPQVGRSNEASILPLEFCYHTRRWCGLISAEKKILSLGSFSLSLLSSSWGEVLANSARNEATTTARNT